MFPYLFPFITFFKMLFLSKHSLRVIFSFIIKKLKEKREIKDAFLNIIFSAVYFKKKIKDFIL